MKLKVQVPKNFSKCKLLSIQEFPYEIHDHLELLREEHFERDLIISISFQLFNNHTPSNGWNLEYIMRVLDL